MSDKKKPIEKPDTDDHVIKMDILGMIHRNPAKKATRKRCWRICEPFTASCSASKSC